MRYIILLIVLSSCGLIIYGYSLDGSEEILAHRCIGSGVALLFLVAMPLFLFTESKGKDFKDYMLNDENVRKMQGKPPREKDES